MLSSSWTACPYCYLLISTQECTKAAASGANIVVRRFMRPWFRFSLPGCRVNRHIIAVGGFPLRFSIADSDARKIHSSEFPSGHLSSSLRFPLPLPGQGTGGSGGKV
ncbi:hypothetical protein Nepgr_033211 [Nepenthes gracilis]|uniref:Uncharacterized protein n=1 Tax=Nepenthes gracilis TaxID=150966 RepID=A0AAD3TK34_NEPGR|nr:hypothetical protein Nepgr_033211 [Nepenthes gracilis]